ncbi:MAG: 50S ribosomal protein L31 [Clostridia bacterium]
MKEQIQPNYHDVAIECACGEKFVSGTTSDETLIKVEVCSKCHPFYTGKQKLVDTGGRVDKFKKRYSL